jgi:hypothetical protein
VSRSRAQRYAAWIDANRLGLLVLSVLLAVLCGWLASRLTIKADLTNLLPSKQPSVRDLVALQKRARPFGTIQIVVESKDVALRARAGALLVEKLSTLETDPAHLVIQFAPDDGPQWRYGWANRFLFADLTDLEAARDGLQARIDNAKLAGNPLFVSLDDDEDPAEAKLEEVEQKLADLEAKAKSPPLRVSPDGTLQLIIIQTNFAASDPVHAKQLQDVLRKRINEVRREVGPGVTFGFTGNVTHAMHEHDSVLDGMVMSAVITVLLVALGLLYYYRSGRIVLAMLWALGVGVAATFAGTWATIGHLNIMTAFLAAIVIGNGINAGLILLARFQEEVRQGVDPKDAIGPAIGGALPGTLAATGTAAVAYVSLVVTDFRGFRQFGAIAGAGILLTWIAAFTVLPAVLCVMARRGWIRTTREPGIGDALARVMPRRRAGWNVTMAIGTAITLIAAVKTADYIAGDPFTHDWRDLQSTTPALAAARKLDEKVRNAFDPKAMLTGQAFQVVIGVDKRDDVASVVAEIKADDARRKPEDRWVHDVRSMDDLLPAEQPAKLAVLDQIRRLIDDPKLQESLDADERAQLATIRPPDGLRPLTDADVPYELAWPFIEKDKSMGKLVIVRGSKALDSFNVDHRLRFAADVRSVKLPAGAVVAGEALVVADIIETMEEDAPKMVAFALFGSILAVLIVIGMRRHGLITVACGLAGVTVMIAACAFAGIKVHFLDLIALPITIGIGIDYAVNLTARDRQDGEKGPRHLLRTTGATVLLCSYTTSIGYGTLMFSANGGIRAFGEAALIGEITCIAMALLVAPAWLALMRDKPAPS